MWMPLTLSVCVAKKEWKRMSGVYAGANIHIMDERAFL